MEDVVREAVALVGMVKEVMVVTVMVKEVVVVVVLIVYYYACMLIYMKYSFIGVRSCRLMSLSLSVCLL